MYVFEPVSVGRKNVRDIYTIGLTDLMPFHGLCTVPPLHAGTQPVGFEV